MDACDRSCEKGSQSKTETGVLNGVQRFEGAVGGSGVKLCCSKLEKMNKQILPLKEKI